VYNFTSKLSRNDRLGHLKELFKEKIRKKSCKKILKIEKILKN